MCLMKVLYKCQPLPSSFSCPLKYKLLYNIAKQCSSLHVFLMYFFRQLLKTELGSFFTEYLQNQLLTKGMVILRDKIRFYEGITSLTNKCSDTYTVLLCEGIVKRITYIK